jgi:hypothetical protein
MLGRVVVGLFVGMLGFYWFDWYFYPTGGPIVRKTEFKKRNATKFRKSSCC